MLNINLSTILLQMANFFILVFILYRFLFKPLQNTLKQRDIETNRAMEEARVAIKEADEKRQEFEEKTHNIKAEIAAQKNEARILIERTRQQMLQEVQSDINRLEVQAEEKLTRMRAEALHQHDKEIGQIATRYVRSLLSDLMNSEIQDIYQNQFLDQLRNIDLAGYVEGERPNEVTYIKAVLARQPKKIYQDQLRSILKKSLDHEFNLSFTVDSDLIAGGVLRFENELIDGSLSGQIEHLKNQYQEPA